MSSMTRCAGWCEKSRERNRGLAEFKLKTIASAGIAEANSKVELYRLLKQAKKVESICREASQKARAITACWRRSSSITAFFAVPGKAMHNSTPSISTINIYRFVGQPGYAA